MTPKALDVLCTALRKTFQLGGIFDLQLQRKNHYYSNFHSKVITLVRILVLASNVITRHLIFRPIA
jgi:hypothetical protein